MQDRNKSLLDCDGNLSFFLDSKSHSWTDFYLLGYFSTSLWGGEGIQPVKISFKVSLCYKGEQNLRKEEWGIMWVVTDSSPGLTEEWERGSRKWQTVRTHGKSSSVDFEEGSLSNVLWSASLAVAYLFLFSVAPGILNFQNCVSCYFCSPVWSWDTLIKARLQFWAPHWSKQKISTNPVVASFNFLPTLSVFPHSSSKWGALRMCSGWQLVVLLSLFLPKVE